GGFVISLDDKSGKSTVAQSAIGTYLYPVFSPDGKRLSYIASRPGGADVWVKDIERDVTTRLTLLSGFANSSSWAPDGKSVFFRMERETGTDLVYHAP